MKKKVFREKYMIPKQDEIYNMNEIIKEVSEKALEKVKKNTKKKKSDK